MGNFKKMFLSVLALIIVVSNVSVSEAAKNNKEDKSVKVEEKKEPLPIVVEGDDISFDEKTGDVYAKGKVVFTQAESVVVGNDIEGNTIKTRIWAKDKTVLTQPDLKLNGYETDYNYGDKTGTMKKVDGVVNHKIVKGNSVEFYPNEIVIYNGTITKCPAKKPDYHISAKRIEIYPNVKLIAYDAKVWVRDKVLYSTSKYETKLGQEKQKSAYPTVGYNSDGIYVKQHLEENIYGNLAAFADLDYYSKHGFRPHYGLINYFKGAELIVEQGKFQDGDDDWIKKMPEFRVSFYPQKVFDLPWHYSVNLSRGKWEDYEKESWHNDYNIYFSRDTIKLSENTNLTLGLGYQVIKESYNSSTQNKYRYDVGVNRSINKKWSMWTSYHYIHNNSNLFDYDAEDLSRELNSGIRYQIDDKNALAIEQRYDLENKNVYDQDFIWYHNLHCLDAKIMYREKRSQIKIQIGVKEW